MLFKTNLEKAFDVKPYRSADMESAIQLWEQMQSRKPPWAKDGVRTIRFSNTIARELAVLVTQQIDIKIEPAFGGSDKARHIQDALDRSFLRKAQENIENMIRMGGIMAKWNGEGIEYLTPDRFLVTDFDSSGNITGAVFFSYHTEKEKFYTKAEWQRFDGKDPEGYTVYKISNKAFVSDNMDDLGREVPLEKTKWKDLQKETEVLGLTKPLFSYLKSPYSNTIDPDSPLGVSLFSECIEELRWLDIAMSTLGTETEQSQPAMFVDEGVIMYARNANIKIPAYIKGLGMGVQQEKTVQQWQPTLQIQNRKEGINFLLSIISYKCGFDPGYFVFNGQTISVATATQVESTERRTINTVLSYRSILDRPNRNGDGRVGFVHDIAYIIDAMETASGLVPVSEFGNYKLYCDFADITENTEENKAFDYQLANAGYMAKWQFLVRNLGMTEDEAKQMVAEAKTEAVDRNNFDGGLFEEE